MEAAPTTAAAPSTSKVFMWRCSQTFFILENGGSFDDIAS